MTDWALNRVNLSFQLGDLTLGRVALTLQSRQYALADAPAPVIDPQPPADALLPGSHGFLQRALPVGERLPDLVRMGNFIRYASLQYRHSYIDMSGGFEAYRQKFSTKTRSTIDRKVRRFSQHCGGELRWVCYRTPSELESFFPLARQVSTKTYQERLLDAGLPDDAGYRGRMLAAAAADRVRAFLLFHGELPVSYLFCPVDQDVLIYAYLGYDPDYRKHSVGTVLQWLALEQLFAEERFRFFDFTEGESEHKRLFATHQRLCANVMFVRASWYTTLLIRFHRVFSRMSVAAGALLDRWGLKAKVRHLLRFSA